MNLRTALRLTLLAACLLPFAAGAAEPAAAGAGNLSPPKARKQVGAIYPRELLQDKVTGVVVVGFIIDQKGNVPDAWATQSPDPRFSEAAIAAVKKWKFTPGRKDGKPVSWNMSVDIRFDLKPPAEKKAK